MKKIYYRVYDKDGFFVSEYTDFIASNFSASINSGYGDLTLSIPRTFDFIWSNIDFNYRIERYVADLQNPSGVLTYAGFVSERDSSVSSNESSSIKTYGYWAKLTKQPIITGTDLKVSYTGQDIGAIMRDLVTKYRAANTATVINAPTTVTIPDIGVTVTQSFNSQTYAEAFIELKDLAGADYYFFLDNDNSLKFNQIVTATADHYFVMGRDIKQARYSETIDQLVNEVYFWNGVPTGSSRIFKKYTSSESIATYGAQSIMHKDRRYTSTASADKWAERKLNAFGNPLTTLDIEVFDNNFSGEGGSQVDIEKIKPGNTFKIVNIDNNAPFANNIYYITQITDFEGKSLQIKSIDASSYVNQQLNELSGKLKTESFGVTHSQPFTT